MEDHELFAFFAGLMQPGSDDAFQKPAWMAEGLCRRRRANWFPSQGEDLVPARNVCAACAVRVDCLNYALDNREQFGVWGGMSTKERIALLKQRRAA